MCLHVKARCAVLNTSNLSHTIESLLQLYKYISLCANYSKEILIQTHTDVCFLAWCCVAKTRLHLLFAHIICSSCTLSFFLHSLWQPNRNLCPCNISILIYTTFIRILTATTNTPRCYSTTAKPYAFLFVFFSCFLQLLCGFLCARQLVFVRSINLKDIGMNGRFIVCLCGKLSAYVKFVCVCVGISAFSNSAFRA